MIFGNLNLGVDEFLVKAFENIVGDTKMEWARMLKDISRY